MLDYFTDPLLRASTLGSMLMCVSAALVGVFLYLRRESLIGEAISHSAYPGLILGCLFGGWLWGKETSILFILLGACLTSILGVYLVRTLKLRFSLSADAALCFTLSSLFGIGILLASFVQFHHPSLYRQAQAYLFGQVATMTDLHIVLYGALSSLTIGVLFLFFKELQTTTFDRTFAQTAGIPVGLIDHLLSFLVILSVVIGIRSVGVVLMSGMLIAPAATARQYSNRLSIVLLLSAIFALTSGFLGNIFSYKLSFPPGPLIVLVATTFCFFSLLFAPKRGLLLKVIRHFLFRHRCLCENVLKALWRLHPTSSTTFEEIAKGQPHPPLYLKVILHQLTRERWIEQPSPQHYQLTKEGRAWAARIVRLHRLWELYLVDHLGLGIEKVHRNAEEMEHIITPELERQLTELLDDPLKDPHEQPIPTRNPSL